jgi:cysteine desulfuration protein SufE
MAQPDFEELVDTFAFLEDWEDRYRHVIDMGKSLPPLAEAERVPATKVEGCASQVWLVPEIEGEGDSARLRFRGESDAMIVKGLIAVLQTLYNGLTVAEARAIDAQAELGRLDLQDHLSSQRSNGLKAMVGRIREIAARA